MPNNQPEEEIQISQQPDDGLHPPFRPRAKTLLAEMIEGDQLELKDNTKHSDRSATTPAEMDRESTFMAGTLRTVVYRWRSRKTRD